MCPPSQEGALTALNVPRSSPATPPSYIPQDESSLAAYALAQSQLPAAIFNHSIRVYLYALRIAIQESSPYAAPERQPVLFAATALHDLGACEAHNGPQRFEVEGADAAAAHMRTSAGSVFSEQEVADVWTAIAVHASPGIAERIAPLARLVRLAVLLDFKVPPATLRVPGEWRAEVEEDSAAPLPRLDPEKVLGDAVVEQALKQPGKAPAASWTGILLRSKLENPDWDGVNKAF